MTGAWPTCEVVVGLLEQLRDSLILGVAHKLHVLLHVVLLERLEALALSALAVAPLLARLAVKVLQHRLAQPLCRPPHIPVEGAELVGVCCERVEELLPAALVARLDLVGTLPLVALHLAQLSRLSQTPHTAQRQRSGGFLQKSRSVAIHGNLGAQ